MEKIDSLRDIIKFNSSFKTSINLYLSLNKSEKVLGYIPTKSSVNFMGDYIKAVLDNKEQATLLVGPYGKGKSHLLLVLLAILSMKRSPENNIIISELIDKVSKVDEVGNVVSKLIKRGWDKKRFLPVLITDTTGDLNQAFLYGLNDALKRDGLLDLVPDTYYSIALERISDWEQNYYETYTFFEKEVVNCGSNMSSLKAELKLFSKEALEMFKAIYPKVTAGSEFNPMAVSDVLPLYKSTSEKLIEDYGYSGIYIVFDEFSKFIESQDGTATGINMHLIQSMCELATDSQNSQIFFTIVRDTRLLVYDEAHKASATETRNTIEKIMTRVGGLEDRALMGLSATPGRTTVQSFDNNLLVSMFGNKIISIDTKLMNAVNLSVQEAANTDVEEDVIKYFQKRGVLSKIIKEELTYPESLSDEEINKIRVVAYSQGYDDFSKTALETIGKNKSRNLRIMQKLRELNSEKKPTIVFACSVKHAQLLSAMLTLEDIPNAVVYGDMPAYERTTAISRFKDTKDNMNIIINYEVLTTGFDATNIECVFIARPTQSVVLYSQMIGRGLRGPQMGGNEICLLVDVKDNLKQYDENMAFSHFNNYWGA